MLCRNDSREDGRGLEKIRKIIKNELPDLTEKAYKVAYDRRIEVIGEQLKEVYESVMSNEKE